MRCDVCEREFADAKGLTIHAGRKHPQISRATATLDRQVLFRRMRELAAEMETK